ncbi:LOW QUALITY PROTEIN: interleukin-18 receptor accessory protein [Molossus nigricans]
MSYWGWMFLWLVIGERSKGFNISGCSTKRFLWTYSAKAEDEFVLLCDLPGPKQSHVPERLPCSGIKDLSDVQWYLQPQNEDTLREITKNYSHILLNKTTLRFLTAEMNNAGSYICRPRARSPSDEACCVRMDLAVEPRTDTCVHPVPRTQFLTLGTTDSIYCPSLGCHSDAQSAEVTWYRNGRLVSEKGSNPMQLDEIYDFHEGTYICDHTQSDNTSAWTVRAVVQVRTIVKNTMLQPDILRPDKDTLEAELGKPLTVHCKARFGFEKDFKPVIRWYSKDSDQKLEILTAEGRSVQDTVENKDIECVLHLKEVTRSDLHKTFICFAQNSIGNTTRSIHLKEKKGVLFLYVLLGTVATLVGMLAAGAALFTYRTEIALLCRTCRSKDEALGGGKEFDAFISYAKWGSFESETASPVSEEDLALNLFPEVLENKYGYTLCLLERDVSPGGVYTEDIVRILKKSRRGIFILSPSYVNGPSVFELQAAVNLALQDRTLKLILVQFRSFQEPDSLPHLVMKALRALPTVTWRGSKSVPPSSRFWAQIRYHMPVNSEGFTWNHLKVTSRTFLLKDSVKQKPLGGAPSPGNEHRSPELPCSSGELTW